MVSSYSLATLIRWPTGNMLRLNVWYSIRTVHWILIVNFGNQKLPSFSVRKRNLVDKLHRLSFSWIKVHVKSECSFIRIMRITSHYSLPVSSQCRMPMPQTFAQTNLHVGIQIMKFSWKFWSLYLQSLINLILSKKSKWNGLARLKKKANESSAHVLSATLNAIQSAIIRDVNIKLSHRFWTLHSNLLHTHSHHLNH